VCIIPPQLAKNHLSLGDNRGQSTRLSETPKQMAQYKLRALQGSAETGGSQTGAEKSAIQRVPHPCHMFTTWHVCDLAPPRTLTFDPATILGPPSRVRVTRQNLGPGVRLCGPMGITQ
jgi:hypothetical protein